MKKLQKLKLKDVILLNDGEMKHLIGGDFYCIRGNGNEFHSMIFSTSQAATEWSTIWSELGWNVTCNSGSSGYIYC